MIILPEIYEASLHLCTSPDHPIHMKVCIDKHRETPDIYMTFNKESGYFEIMPPDFSQYISDYLDDAKQKLEKTQMIRMMLEEAEDHPELKEVVSLLSPGWGPDDGLAANEAPMSVPAWAITNDKLIAAFLAGIIECIDNSHDPSHPTIQTIKKQIAATLLSMSGEETSSKGVITGASRFDNSRLIGDIEERIRRAKDDIPPE